MNRLLFSATCEQWTGEMHTPAPKGVSAVTQWARVFLACLLLVALLFFALTALRRIR